MSNMEIILICACGALFVGLCVVVGLLIANSKKLNRYTAREERTDKVKVIDGVRYTASDVVADGSEVKVSLNKGDIILKRNETVVVKKGGAVIPGKYTVLAADNTDVPFNIRVGDYVREFTHNTPIVLDEGEVITPVSHTIILR